MMPPYDGKANRSFHKKVVALNHKAWELRLIDAQESMRLSRETWRMSEENKYERGLAESARTQAYCYWRLGQLEQARACCETALEKFQSLDLPRGVAESLSVCGLISWHKSDYDGALHLQMDALRLSREHHAPDLESAILGYIGNIFLKQAKFDDAVAQHQFSLKIAESLPHHTLKAFALSNLGNTYQRLGDYRRALDCLSAALALYGDLGSRHGKLVALTNLGVVYAALGDFSKALEHYVQSLELQRALKDLHTEASILNNIGSIYYKMSDYERALDIFQQSYALFKTQGDKQAQAAALNNIGDMHYLLGRYDQGLQSLRDSLALREEIGDKRGTAISSLNLALTYFKTHRHKKAQQFAEQSRSIAESLKDKHHQTESLLTLAQIFLEQGSSDLMARAVSVASNALALAKEINAKDLTARALDVLSTAARKQHRYKDACLHLLEHRQIKDDLLGEEARQNLHRLQIRFQLDQERQQKEIYQLRAEQYALEVENQRKQLTIMATTLVQKNELIERLKNEVKQISQDISGHCQARFESFVQKLDEGNEREKGWSLFEKQFEMVHQHFAKALSEKLPNLTVTELRLCMLLRVQLSTKEIAKLLFLSPRSVQTYRFRLRKKLRLKSEQGLIQFLNAL